VVSTFLSQPGSRDVFFFDEGRFGLKTETGKRWGKRGEILHTEVSQSYQNFYAYSSVSPFIGKSFSLFLPWVNTEVMNRYLSEMSDAYPEQKLLIIWDGAGWHHSKDLVIPDNIQIAFLPPYSPELNPVERLWWWLRRQVCRNKLFTCNDVLMSELGKALCSLSSEAFKTLCACSYLHYFN
jgi:transposase